MTASAVAFLRRPSGWQLVALVGAVLCLLLILSQASFFLRPGPIEVLRGLAHHLFVIALLLVITLGTRTVSVASLGLFWLVGVFPVVFLAMVLQWLPAELLGTGPRSPVSTVVVPILDTAVYLVPVAVYYAIAIRAKLQPAASDGLLIGFAVGAGYAFFEDAVIGDILLSGDGWFAAQPWSLFAPTISEVGDSISLNHALWAALGGLSLGVAVMLRHRRYAWLIAVIGPMLIVLNHAVVNVISNSFSVGGRGGLDPLAAIADLLTLGGVLPLLVVYIGAMAVALLEYRILASVSPRWPTVPSVPLATLGRLLARARTAAGLRRYLATSRYARLRRLVMFAVWRARDAGTAPPSEQVMQRLNQMAAFEAGLFSPHPNAPTPVLEAQRPVS
jgi:protease prsW family protein